MFEDLEHEFFSGLYVEDFLGVLTFGDGVTIIRMLAAVLNLLQ
jgi:hypothetical protein